ncbi:ribonuclease H family protein [Jiangella gansuensis]|uniref:ribonuclease H family protein n=1 Tax=Jiangella gansuensis TaxID=281473 RepID=UPI001B7F8528|nr:ribonuclease H [Jiangella gansuensis]
MLAKFAGRCGVCAGGIKPGEEIESSGSGRNRTWAHAGCAGAPALVEVPAGVGAGSAAGNAPGGAPAAPVRKRRPRPPSMPAPDGAVEVFTDGACSGTPGPGGWAWAVDRERFAAGSEPSTTNQRMEIRAALEAVRALSGPLVVVSDSAYVVNCFRDGWWRNWRARGWVTSARAPVANRDLWEPLIDLFDERGDIAFRWVKGHSGDPMNDLVDELAVAAKLAQS